MYYLLLGLFGTYIFLFNLFIKQFKKLEFLVNLMPNKKFERVNGLKHPLVGKVFPFSRELLTEEITIVLLTSPTCSACQGSYEEAISVVNQFNLDFLHLVAVNDDNSEIWIEEKEVINTKKNYYQLNIPNNLLINYNLFQYPQYIIIKNKKIVEVTGIIRRIEYLMENNILDNL
ncbi:hypothetical protein [Bacillus andreraoultii]|uniref:hypothetical protein n=1 Tax=Bacillus andreraoultii TaxID=1499685 RepID=UPI00053AD5C0|nr:hypothetical protein [Bacillus andreraoultii]